MLTSDRALSFAWGVDGKTKPAKTVIRGGYGWFFDRFQSTNVLQAIRQNGVNQQQYVVKNPSPNETAATASAAASEAAPTTYSIAPNLTAPVNMQAAIGVEHRFGQKFTTRDHLYQLARRASALHRQYQCLPARHL